MKLIPHKVGNTEISQKGQIIHFETINARKKLFAVAFLIVFLVIFSTAIVIPLLYRIDRLVPWWLTAIQFASIGFLCVKLIASPSDYCQINLKTGKIESRIQIDQFREGSVNAVRIIHDKSLFNHSIHLQDPQYHNILTLRSSTRQEVNQVIGFLKDVLPPWEIRRQAWPVNQRLIDRDVMEDQP